MPSSHAIGSICELGIFGTLSTGWIVVTSAKVSTHSVKIAVLETDVKYIKEGIEDIKAHLGVEARAKKKE